eukprot:TRINITY_DN26787_c0_g2_i1.p1 TRINITY_DN26787_c0_g2~~TRINITY_DN26787_c0_g2_i1.p1  ORF type:complete len:365 (-),score=129.17 TRINITY_DN26787_c0_g2_i1:388-1482(-)
MALSDGSCTTPAEVGADSLLYTQLPSVASWLLPLPRHVLTTPAPLCDDARGRGTMDVQVEAELMAQQVIATAALLVACEEEEVEDAERSALLDEEEAGAACEDFVVYEAGNLRLLPPPLDDDDYFEFSGSEGSPATGSSTSGGSSGSCFSTPRSSGWSTPKKIQEAVSNGMQLVSDGAQQGMEFVSEKWEATDVEATRYLKKTEAFVHEKSEAMSRLVVQQGERVAKGVSYVRSKSRERLAYARKRSEPLQRGLEAALVKADAVASEMAAAVNSLRVAKKINAGLGAAVEKGEVLSDKVQRGFDSFASFAERAEAVSAQMAEKAQKGFEFAAERTGSAKQAAGNMLPSPRLSRRHRRALRRSGA